MAKNTKTKIAKTRSKKKMSKVEVTNESVSNNKKTSLQKHVKNNKNILVLAVFLVLLGVFLYFSKSLFVVAMVNGKPITRFSLIQQLEKTNGKTALESLINATLIQQEAKKEGVVVTDADVESELEKVRLNLETQGMNLDAALSAQGMTMDDLQKELRMKQTVEKILKNEIQVSNEDVKKYFEDNSQLFGEGAKFEDLEQSIKDQLQSEKLSVEFQSWYSKLKDESDIKYFLNF
jgi:hypothetical protein